MPNKKLTPQQIASIHHQANNGVSVVALCAKYNLSSSHIYRIKQNTRRNRRTKKLSTYNGWTNHATWLFYLHHSEDIYNWHHEHNEHEKQNHALEHIKEYFEEMYSELMIGCENYYLTDVMNNELRDVNWQEILKTVTENNDKYDANWTEEGAITNYLDHVAENKERERN